MASRSKSHRSMSMNAGSSHRQTPASASIRKFVRKPIRWTPPSDISKNHEELPPSLKIKKLSNKWLELQSAITDQSNGFRSEAMGQYDSLDLKQLQSRVYRRKSKRKSPKKFEQRVAAQQKAQREFTEISQEILSLEERCIRERIDRDRVLQENDRLQAQNETLSQKVSSLKSQKKVNAQITRDDRTRRAMQRVSIMERAIAVKQQMIKLKVQTKTLISENEIKVNSIIMQFGNQLNQRIADEQSRMKHMEESAFAHQVEIGRLQQTMYSLQTERTQLIRDMTNMDGAIRQRDQSLTEFEGMISKLKKERNQMSLRMESLRDQGASLEEDVQFKRKQIENLSQENRSLNQNIRVLKEHMNHQQLLEKDVRVQFKAIEEELCQQNLSLKQEMKMMGKQQGVIIENLLQQHGGWKQDHHKTRQIVDEKENDLKIKSDAVRILTEQCLKYEENVIALQQQCDKANLDLVESRRRLSFEKSQHQRHAKFLLRRLQGFRKRLKSHQTEHGQQMVSVRRESIQRTRVLTQQLKDSITKALGEKPNEGVLPQSVVLQKRVIQNGAESLQETMHRLKDQCTNSMTEMKEGFCRLQREMEHSAAENQIQRGRLLDVNKDQKSKLKESTERIDLLKQDNMEMAHELQTISQQFCVNETTFRMVCEDLQSGKDEVHVEYNRRIHENESENKSLFATNQRLKSELEELQKEVQKHKKLKVMVNLLETKRVDMENSVEKMKAKISALHTKHDNNEVDKWRLTELQSVVQSSALQINDLKMRCDHFSKQKQTVKAQIEELTSNNQILMTKNQKQSANIQRIESDKLRLETDGKELMNTIDDLSSRNQKLCEYIRSFDTHLVKLREEMNDIKSNFEAASRQAHDQQDSFKVVVGNLTANKDLVIAGLENRCNRLDDEIQRIMQRHQSLYREIAQQKQQKYAVIKERNGLHDDLESLIKRIRSTDIGKVAKMVNRMKIEIDSEMQDNQSLMISFKNQLRELLAEFNNIISLANEEKERMTALWKDMQKTASSQRSIIEHQASKLSESTGSIDKMRTENLELHQQLRKVKKHVNELETQIGVLQESLTGKENANQALESKVTELGILNAQSTLETIKWFDTCSDDEIEW